VDSIFLEELGACCQVNPEVEAAITVHSTQPYNTEDHSLNMYIVNTNDFFMFGVLMLAFYSIYIALFQPSN
jgi:hypothetical protein